MPPTPGRTGALLVTCFLVSLLLNLGYVVAVEPVLPVGPDASGYDAIGFDLAQGKGFPVGGGWQPKREPGYPMVLAAVYSVVGHDYHAVRLVHVILSSSFCLLVFCLARTLSRSGKLSQTMPLVAAGLAVVYPAFIFYAGLLLRETLLTFLVIIALIMLSWYGRSGRPRHAALFGLMIGLSALVDARALYFSVVPALGWLVLRKPWRQVGIFLTLSLGVALLTISPWTIRNYVVLDRVVLLTTAGYKGLWLATNPDEPLEWEYDRGPLKELGGISPEEREQREKEMARLALVNLKKYPGAYVKNSLRRSVRLWSGGHSNMMPLMEQSLGAAVAAREWSYAALKAAFVGVNLVYVLGGIAGAVFCIRRVGASAALPVLAFPLYIAVLHSLLFATPRYHIPAMPALIVLFAAVVAELAERSAPLRKPA